MDGEVYAVLVAGDEFGDRVHEIVAQGPCALHASVVRLADLVHRRVGVLEVLDLVVQDVFSKHGQVELLQVCEKALLLEALFFYDLFELGVRADDVEGTAKQCFPVETSPVHFHETIQRKHGMLAIVAGHEAVLEVVESIKHAVHHLVLRLRKL